MKKEQVKLTGNFLKEVSPMFESHDKNKFMDCYYKLSDICRRGLPCVKVDSKAEKQFFEKLDTLEQVIRETRQKTSIVEVLMKALSTPQESYTPETIIWTLCLAIVLQYPRRELRWSSMEITAMMRNASRLKSNVLPTLSWEEKENVDLSERFAICWCHSVLLYVLRSMMLFAVSRGLDNDEEVWEICAVDMSSEPAGKAILYLLKKQRSFYRGLVLGCHDAKPLLLSRPLLSVLRTFVAASDDSRLEELQTTAKRHAIERTFSRHCVFESDEGVPVKRSRLEAASEVSCSDLLEHIRVESNPSEMNEEDTLTLSKSLVILLSRLQVLKSEEKNETLIKVVNLCRSSSIFLSRYPLNGQLHLNFLRLWLFLARRKRLLSEIPNAHMFFTFLFTPPYEEMTFDLFVASTTALSLFLMSYLSLSRSRILAAPAIFMEAIRAAIAEVLRRSNTAADKLTTHQTSALCGVILSFNNLLMRLCESEHRPEVSRIVRLLVEDYFVRVQTITLHPDVKRAILQIIFLLLDIIDPFCLEQLKIDLKLGPRELLKRVLIDFRASRNKNGMN